MHLCWVIAQKAVVVEVDEARVPLSWRQAWPSYARVYSEIKRPDIYIEAEVSSNASSVNLDSFQRIYQEETDDTRQRRFRVESIECSGALWKDGECYLGRFVTGFDDLSGLQSFTMNCLFFSCQERDELFLHASGVYRQGRLWLFSGPSGVGKTTIARDLLNGGEPFSMDYVILSVGSDGVVAVHSTPFSDEQNLIRPRCLKPIAGIALIEKASYAEMVTPKNGVILGRFLAQFNGYYRGSEQMSWLLDKAGTILESTKVFVLRFSRSESFWELLDRLESEPVLPAGEKMN